MWVTIVTAVVKKLLLLQNLDTQIAKSNYKVKCNETAKTEDINWI